MPARIGTSGVAVSCAGIEPVLDMRSKKDLDVKLAINWVIGDLFAALNKIGKSIKESPISSKNLAKLIDLIKNNTISGRISKEVFELMINDNRDPKVIVEEKGITETARTKPHPTK